MSGLGRIALVLIGLGMAFNAAGLGDLGPLVMVLGVTVIGVTMVTGARPTSRRSRSGVLQAHRLSFLGQYRDPLGIGAAIVLGAALIDVFKQTSGWPPVIAQALMLAVMAFAAFIAPRFFGLLSVPDLIGLLATVILIIGMVDSGDWRLLSVPSFFVAAAVASAAVLASVWLPAGTVRLLRFPWTGNRDLRFLGIFGLFSLIALVADPSAGLDDSLGPVGDFWANYGYGAAGGALLLVIGLAVYTAWAPRLMVGLFGILLVALRLYMLGIEHEYAPTLGALSDIQTELLVWLLVTICGAVGYEMSNRRNLT